MPMVALLQLKLINKTKIYIMKNSNDENFNATIGNTVLSAVEILKNKYNEMQIVADEYYLKLLKNCFDKNSRKVFDKIISGMGTLAFYKNNEPLYDSEKSEIKHLEQIQDFLSKWDDILGLTGNYIVITSGGILVNQ